MSEVYIRLIAIVLEVILVIWIFHAGSYVVELLPYKIIIGGIIVAVLSVFLVTVALIHASWEKRINEKRSDKSKE